MRAVQMIWIAAHDLNYKHAQKKKKKWKKKKKKNEKWFSTKFRKNKKLLLCLKLRLRNLVLADEEGLDWIFRFYFKNIFF